MQEVQDQKHEEDNHYLEFQSEGHHSQGSRQPSPFKPSEPISIDELSIEYTGDNSPYSQYSGYSPVKVSSQNNSKVTKVRRDIYEKKLEESKVTKGKMMTSE